MSEPSPPSDATEDGTPGGPVPEASKREAAKGSAEFEREATRSQPSLVAEFIAFLAAEKKWWLAPIVIVLLLLTLIAWVGGSSLAPWIYPGL